MAHVVTQACHDCRYTDCVSVCPVECFYIDDKMVYIDPSDCIDCEACVPECPVEAIFSESNVPANQKQYIQINLERAKALKTSGGHCTEKQDPLEGPECKKKS
ncbi:MAG: 4Fe-4S dicluster domain-containing protein [Gemmataceae bacterium]|jgi:ferredoxin